MYKKDKMYFKRAMSDFDYCFNGYWFQHSTFNKMCIGYNSKRDFNVPLYIMETSFC